MTIDALFPIFVNDQDLGLTISKINDKILLQWNSLDNAVSYTISMRQGESGCYTVIGTSYVNSFAITGLETPGLYGFKIEAIVTVQATVNSKNLNVQVNDDGTITPNPSPVPPPPEPADIPAPTNIVGTPTDTTVSLTWDAVNLASMYRIFIDTTENGDYATGVDVVPTAYTRTGLTPDTTYYFKIAAMVQGVVGTLSDPVPVKTLVTT